MDTLPGSPGDGTHRPLPADAPLPPGADAEEIVDDLDARIRDDGSAEVEEADEEADAVEEGASADSEQDPTDDGAEQDAPPA